MKLSSALNVIWKRNLGNLQLYMLNNSPEGM
jgi:hypothetical protein